MQFAPATANQRTSKIVIELRFSVNHGEPFLVLDCQPGMSNPGKSLSRRSFLEASVLAFPSIMAISAALPQASYLLVDAGQTHGCDAYGNHFICEPDLLEVVGGIDLEVIPEFGPEMIAREFKRATGISIPAQRVYGVGSIPCCGLYRVRFFSPTGIRIYRLWLRSNCPSSHRLDSLHGLVAKRQ